MSTLNYLMCIVSGERQFSPHHTYEILMVAQAKGHLERPSQHHLMPIATLARIKYSGLLGMHRIHQLSTCRDL